jgi:uncharacterized secreted protein with C-terminal beta-propeller domain
LDISDQAKMTEYQVIIQNYYNSLSDDERLRVENETSNKMQGYVKEHIRDLEKSGIVKIDVDGLKIAAVGGVPGRPLNQFSMDEYDNHLRIATTVGNNIFAAGESANDIYALDKNLNIVGKIVDLGLGERIYSARFIEDKGYIVTFRQIDPFYIVDLSNPTKPQLKGELKIPGFSSYLHPINKETILGVGEENGRVKLSLFDVSSSDSPKEVAKYSLDENWTEVASNHHAFLMDAKHEIFFLPGGKGGYIFSYKGNQLDLTKAVSDLSIKRALYLNDYLYIIGENKLVVLDEGSWQEVGSLSF